MMLIAALPSVDESAIARIGRGRIGVSTDGLARLVQIGRRRLALTVDIGNDFLRVSPALLGRGMRKGAIE